MKKTFPSCIISTVRLSLQTYILFYLTNWNVRKPFEQRTQIWTKADNQFGKCKQSCHWYEAIKHGRKINLVCSIRTSHSIVWPDSDGWYSFFPAKNPFILSVFIQIHIENTYRHLIHFGFSADFYRCMLPLFLMSFRLLFASVCFHRDLCVLFFWLFCLRAF